MKKRLTTVQIQNPCSENWGNMTATLEGRHCHSCAKEVFDFTNQTPEEIISFFRNTTTQTCGIFRKNQLKIVNQLLTQKISPSKWIPKPYNLVLSSLLLLASANACQVKVQVDEKNSWVLSVKKEAEQEKLLPKSAIYTPIHLKGIVKDYASQKTIAQADVKLRLTENGIQRWEISLKTNAEGMYEFKVYTDRTQISSINLYVTHIDYHQQYKKVDLDVLQQTDLLIHKKYVEETDIIFGNVDVEEDSLYVDDAKRQKIQKKAKSIRDKLVD
jgi:hypothetical protein